MNDDVFAAIADLTTQYNRSGNTGQFTAERDGKFVHVQKTLRSNRGGFETVQPISETTLLWQAEPGTCFAALGDLSEALGRARGFSIAMGSVPPGALLSHYCDIRGPIRSVGEVLDSIMKELEVNLVTGKDASDYGYTWDLVYDPNWNRYFLGIVLVRDRIPDQPPTATIGTKASEASTKSSSNVGSRIAHH